MILVSRSCQRKSVNEQFGVNMFWMAVYIVFIVRVTNDIN